MIALDIAKTELNLGISAPVRLLHITDAHISRAYAHEMDDPSKFAARKAAFDGDLENGAELRLEAALEYAKENDLLPVFTGDIWDYMSKANFDYWDALTKDTDHIYAAGNHDFCTWPGADNEDLAHKLSVLPRVAPHSKDNLFFDSRVINGLNIVTMDDTYYLFTKGQKQMLQAELAKGLPIVLFLHVPLFNQTVADIQLKKGSGCAYLAAPPDDYLEKFVPVRAAQQRPDCDTLDMVDFIKSQPLIKAVFAGHLHFHHDHLVSDSLPQFITGSAYLAQVREIVIR